MQDGQDKVEEVAAFGGRANCIFHLPNANARVIGSPSILFILSILLILPILFGNFLCFR